MSMGSLQNSNSDSNANSRRSGEDDHTLSFELAELGGVENDSVRRW
eukprot:CAMPEP_0196191344 /NCGR_PEP_ID=MMETSP0911-20130528/48022_1 /TAXON_ID=49265 /ORGANISM="Thalassiosira rotula, Strain GSO102" /LENGTH=45 /DNA_ID= /DNA_START= /DNA_END= /DNA_ORIENTATION=